MHSIVASEHDWESITQESALRAYPLCGKGSSCEHVCLRYDMSSCLAGSRAEYSIGEVRFYGA